MLFFRALLLLDVYLVWSFTLGPDIARAKKITREALQGEWTTATVISATHNVDGVEFGVFYADLTRLEVSRPCFRSPFCFDHCGRAPPAESR